MAGGRIEARSRREGPELGAVARDSQLYCSLIVMLLLARTKQLNKASRRQSRRKAVQSRGAGLEHLSTRKRESKRLCEAALHGIFEEPLQMTLVYHT